MGKELTFDNLHNHLYDFTKIENGIIDISGYDFVEPVGIAILKAIQQEMKDVGIRSDPNSRFDSYLKTLYEASYDESRTYIPLEVVKSGNIDISRDRLVKKIMSDFKDLESDDKEDLKRYLDYMVGEILNNAIQHSLSPIGAIITAQHFPTQRKLQIVVVDRGVGFLHNIQKRYQVNTEQDAILKALEKGVSSSPTKMYFNAIDNAGYGLYALKTIIEKTNGKLMIISNNGIVKLGRHYLTAQELQNTNWKGSIVAFEFFENEIEFSKDDFFRIYIWDQDEELF
jgi:Histidine kinase-, DNA gyrase B-, and HSP90-like ATPase.